MWHKAIIEESTAPSYKKQIPERQGEVMLLRG
jgi:hypothetical protein